MASLRQIRANTENAKRNTGERSSGGAGNARTHGLTASKCISDQEQQLIDAKLADLERVLFPDGPLELEEVKTIAAASIRIERCQLEEHDWRLTRAERAEFWWDEDRQFEAMKHFEGLHKKPKLVLAKLLQTLRGCRIVLDAFRDLAGRVRGTSATDTLRPLDENGRQRAFDLLGLSEDRRVGCTPLDPPGGAASDAAVAAHQDALIAARIVELEAMVSDDRIAHDESVRVATVNGAAGGIDDQTRLIRRYESEARRVKKEAHANLKQLQAEAKALKKQALDRQVSAMLVPRRIVDMPGWAEEAAQAASAPAEAPAQAAASPKPAPAPVPPPAAPAPPVVAPEATPETVTATPMWIFEEVMAETATMGATSNSQPLSRRERKAAARAAHRTIR